MVLPERKVKLSVISIGTIHSKDGRLPGVQPFAPTGIASGEAHSNRETARSEPESNARRLEVDETTLRCFEQEIRHPSKKLKRAV